jgi:predicted TPR repeat methyltransferase
MLEKAAARGLYDDLVEAELTSYLGDSADAFDVIAASDTLNYFGALQGVLAAAHAALHAGGTVHFTLEDAGGKSSLTTGYTIHPDGRYMHTESYARGALAEAGFVVLEIEKGFLRREGDAYVAGLVISARKPS